MSDLDTLINDLDAALAGQPNVNDQWWQDCGTIKRKLLSLRQQAQPTREEGWIEAVATELARADLATMLPDVDVLSQVDVGPVVSAYTNKLRDAVAAAGLAAPIDASAHEGGGERVGWETDAEWALEQRAFAWANNSSLPSEACALIGDLWKQYVLAASPAEPAAHSLQTLAPASDAVKPGDET